MNARQICCHRCNHVWEFMPPLGRRDECPSCRQDARVCLNCRFFDRSAYRECREEQAEWVKEKNTGNFCGYFDASANLRGQTKDDQSTKSKLEKLFSDGKSGSGNGTLPGEESGPAQKTNATLQEQLQKFLNSRK